MDAELYAPLKNRETTVSATVVVIDGCVCEVEFAAVSYVNAYASIGLVMSVPRHTCNAAVVTRDVPTFKLTVTSDSPADHRI